MRVFIHLLIVLGLGSALYAQSTQITGVITDSSGAAVPAATVSLHNVATGVKLETKTNNAGIYLTPPVAPGEYSMTAEATGFALSRVEGVKVEVGESRTVNLTLQPAEARQSVTVVASAPELTTDRPDRGNQIEGTLVDSVPLNVRNPLQVINFAQGVVAGQQSAAGVASNHSGSDLGPYLTNSFRINGGKSNSTDVLLDGATSMAPNENEVAAVVQVDAVSEFRVITNAYSPEYGRTSSAIISFSMKSGTNTLHGSVFDFLRNSDLDANGFNANAAGTPKGHTERNQFGYALGGPVFIPKLYNGHNRTFFFSSYEGLRETDPSSLLATVPTALERQGNFSQTRDTNGNLIAIYDPATTQLNPNAPNGTNQYIRTPFLGNIIPASRFNQVGRNILNGYALPNQTGQELSSTNNYFSSAPSGRDGNRVSTKVDHRINDHHSVFARWMWFKDVSTAALVYPGTPDPSGTGQSTAQPAFNWQIHHTWTVNSTAVFEQHLAFASYGFIGGFPNFNLGSLGLPSNAYQGAPAVFPTVNATRLTVFGPNALSQNQSGTTWQYLGSFSVLKGRHSMKFGFDARKYRSFIDSLQLPTVSATSNFSGGPNPAAAAALSGSGVADLLLGAATYAATITAPVNSHQPYFSLFAQDTFRASRKLTLTYGLRYNLDLPGVENNNRFDYLDLSAPSPLRAQVPAFPNLRGGVGYVGTGGLGPRIAVTDLLMFDPRAGLAYQIDPKTVFRAGAGIFHAPQVGTYLLGSALGSTVTTTSNAAEANGVTPLFNLSNPLPNGLNQPSGSSLGLNTLVGQNIYGPDRKQLLPYTNQWSVDLQRQFPAGIVMTLSYVGNTGVHLPAGVATGGALNLNQIPDSGLSLGSALTKLVPNPFYGVITDPTSTLSAATVQRGQLLRPYPQFLNVYGVEFPIGHSSYQALQVSVERRFSGGLAVLFNYTRSKNIDNVAEWYAGTGPSAAIQNYNCYSCSRSLSDSNVPNNLRLSLVYQLPFGVGKPFVHHGFAARVMGGWSVASFLTVQTGFPIAVTSPNNSGSFGGGTPETPNATGISDQVSGGPQIRNGGLYFNPAAFTQTPAYAFGNVSRYLPDITAPGISNWDIQVTRQFPIRERLKLDFRAEFFNAFNHVQYAGPNTSITSSSFGEIFLSQVNTPRNIQVAMRLVF